MDDLLADPVVLAAWFGVEPSEPKVILALRATSQRFRGAVRHHVSHVVDDVEILDGNGLRSMLLRNAPVAEVSEVLVDGVLLAATEYRYGRRDGRLRRMCGLWPDLLPVQVTYTHGHDPVPEDIAEVVIDQARALYKVLPGIQSITTGAESFAFGAAASIGVTEQWSSAVQRHRLNRGDEA